MKFLEVKLINGDINLVGIESVTKVNGGVIHTEMVSVSTIHDYDEIRSAIRDHMLSSKIIIKVAPKSEMWT